MLKSTIADASVRIIPSEKLVSYLKAHTKKEGHLPENIQKLLHKNSNKKVSKEDPKIIKFDQNEIEAIEEMNKNHSKCVENKNQQEETEPSGVEDLSSDEQTNNKLVKDFLAEPEIIDDEVVKDTRPALTNSDLRWIFNILQERRKTDSDTPYLNELLQGSELILPENHYVERNPVLEERCKKLRKEQEQREYNKMTKNVDSIRKRDPEDTIAYQMRSINSQLIAILQFVFSVAAGFAFGFIGIALIVGDLDFGFRLLLGIMFALIIALAEIYFLAKKLNEEYETKPEGPIYNDYGTPMSSSPAAAQAKKDN